MLQELRSEKRMKLFVMRILDDGDGWKEVMGESEEAFRKSKSIWLLFGC